MRMVAWLMLSFCSLLLTTVSSFFLPFSGRYGLVAGRSAGYGGKEVEGGRHVLGGAVLVVGTIAGIVSVPLEGARMLLLPDGIMLSFFFGFFTEFFLTILTVSFFSSCIPNIGEMISIIS